MTHQSYKSARYKNPKNQNNIEHQKSGNSVFIFFVSALNNKCNIINILKMIFWGFLKLQVFGTR